MAGLDLAAAAGTDAVVLVDEDGVADVAAVDEVVGAGSRATVAADGAGGAAVGRFDGAPPVVCVVGVGVVGDDAVGSTVGAAVGDDGDGMEGFVLYSYLDAFPQVLHLSCPSLDHDPDPSWSPLELFPSAPYSEAALEGGVFVVYHVAEVDLHVLV